MIGFLRGKIINKKPPYLTLDVQGVGYELQASMNTFYSLPEVGSEIQILTHLIIREDAHLLFGFVDDDERYVFRALIKVSGVGAKMALTLLSGIEASDFKDCIDTSDTERLTRLPGIGKKTAERLVVEMRDRLKDWQQAETKERGNTDSAISPNDPVSEAVSALIALGYKPQEASRFVHAVAAEDMDSEALIREALKASVK